MDWASERRRASGSWPAIAPRMRYIYAYPEEVPAWIQQYEAQKHAQPGKFCNSYAAFKYFAGNSAF